MILVDALLNRGKLFGAQLLEQGGLFGQQRLVQRSFGHVEQEACFSNARVQHGFFELAQSGLRFLALCNGAEDLLKLALGVLDQHARHDSDAGQLHQAGQAFNGFALYFAKARSGRLDLFRAKAGSGQCGRQRQCQWRADESGSRQEFFIELLVLVAVVDVFLDRLAQGFIPCTKGQIKGSGLLRVALNKLDDVVSNAFDNPCRWRSGLDHGPRQSCPRQNTCERQGGTKAFANGARVTLGSVTGSHLATVEDFGQGGDFFVLHAQCLANAFGGQVRQGKQGRVKAP